MSHRWSRFRYYESYASCRSSKCDAAHICGSCQEIEIKVPQHCNCIYSTVTSSTNYCSFFNMEEIVNWMFWEPGQIAEVLRNKCYNIAAPYSWYQNLQPDLVELDFFWSWWTSSVLDCWWKRSRVCYRIYIDGLIVQPLETMNLLVPRQRQSLSCSASRSSCSGPLRLSPAALLVSLPLHGPVSPLAWEARGERLHCSAATRFRVGKPLPPAACRLPPAACRLPPVSYRLSPLAWEVSLQHASAGASPPCSPCTRDEGFHGHGQYGACRQLADASNQTVLRRHLEEHTRVASRRGASLHAATTCSGECIRLQPPF